MDSRLVFLRPLGLRLGSLGVSSLLETIVAFVPSPADMGPETARTPAGVEEKIGVDSSLLGAIVFKTTADPFVGRQTYFRVFGGTITSDSRVFNPNKNTEERLSRIVAMSFCEPRSWTRVLSS